MPFLPTIKCDNCRSNGCACAAVGVRFGRVRKMNSNGKRCRFGIHSYMHFGPWSLKSVVIKPLVLGF
jgi:hypothetical protein